MSALKLSHERLTTDDYDYTDLFTPMVQVFGEQTRKAGNYRLQLIELTEEFAKKERFWGALRGQSHFYQDVQAGKYIGLFQESQSYPWMSDTIYERRSNARFIKEARGHVLIGGQGIGMLIPALTRKPEVLSITVLELEQAVIDLTFGPLADWRQRTAGRLRKPYPSLVVEQADVESYGSDRRFDTIYMDIWADISSDNWEQMKRLKRKYKKLLAEGGQYSAWEDRYTHFLVHGRFPSRSWK